MCRDCDETVRFMAVRQVAHRPAAAGARHGCPQPLPPAAAGTPSPGEALALENGVAAPCPSPPPPLVHGRARTCSSMSLACCAASAFLGSHVTPLLRPPKP